MIPREIGGIKYSELTLGTVQLGMPYGAVNDTGQPSRTQAIEIVRAALQSGVTAFDTARGYGDSEAVLGSALAGLGRSEVSIITKLGLPRLIGTSSKKYVRMSVDASVALSCAALRQDSVDVLLLHGWEQRHACEGVVWERLLELHAESKIRLLGASVYAPREALAALCDARIRHLQIPVNVLDWRWRSAGVCQAVADRPDVTVHARSALLQGVLAHSADRWPQINGFDANACVRELERLAERLGRQSVKDLCLAYVRSQSWITSVVVGCETMQQLRDNVRLFSTPLLSEAECDQLESVVPRPPENLLNPSRWKLHSESAYAS